MPVTDIPCLDKVIEMLNFKQISTNLEMLGTWFYVCQLRSAPVLCVLEIALARLYCRFIFSHWCNTHPGTFSFSYFRYCHYFLSSMLGAFIDLFLFNLTTETGDSTETLFLSQKSLVTTLLSFRRQSWYSMASAWYLLPWKNELTYTF